MPASVKVTGLERATSLLKLVGDAAREVGKTRARIISAVPYSHWINEGFYLHGRRGRTRARKFMQAGLRAVEARMPDAVARNVERGPRAVRNAVSGVLGEGTKAARSAAPEVGGGLRRGIHTTAGARG